MFTKGLSEQTQKNLELLSHVPFVSNYYLAGGTALSLHFGHRFSHDLDFFSIKAIEPVIITSSLKDKGKLEIFQNEYKTFNGQLNGVKLSFFEYPYHLLKPAVKFHDIQIAGIIDIGCMKLDAIASRGRKRDFIDLYTICKRELTLDKLFPYFRQKYSGIEYNILHLLKSLVYFEDADKDEMPVMLEHFTWEEVKIFFRNEIKKNSL